MSKSISHLYSPVYSTYEVELPKGQAFNHSRITLLVLSVLLLACAGIAFSQGAPVWGGVLAAMGGTLIVGIVVWVILAKVCSESRSSYHTISTSYEKEVDVEEESMARIFAWVRNEDTDREPTDQELIASFSKMDSRGCYPVHVAAWYLQWDKLERMQTLGADLRIQDRRGRNLLHMALSTPGRIESTYAGNHRAFLMFLIGAGVSLDERDEHGYTPLGYAQFRFQGYRNDPGGQHLQNLRTFLERATTRE